MQTDDLRSEALTSLDKTDQAAIEKSNAFSSLLGDQADLGLTKEEARELTAFNRSLKILGPAGGAVMVCPGNQVGIPIENRCPYAAKCPLLRAQKAPAEKLCPIEREIVEDRFGAWCSRIGVDAANLTEDARSAVSTLTYLDLQEQRCTNILAAGEAARMTQVNVTDAVVNPVQDPETGGIRQEILPLTFERVLHVNAELLAQVQNQRRMILKDWMLTPEQQFKIHKASGKAKGNDLSLLQSSRGDLLRKSDPDFS